ncbi:MULTISPECIES: hypothetical protein [Mumia]|uniref:hypothetical protein n=1 Tax=Mumia TaxID=1546255 RepID=UPI00141E58BE|nr:MULTISPECIES: hypothetical protein [unclassified Mumia]QMW67740.1 hypothetical protein H4N58_07700 [Mumia sp. ZJ1417]
MSGSTSDDEEFERIVAGLELSLPDADEDPPDTSATNALAPPAGAQEVFQPRWSDPLPDEEDDDAWQDGDFVPPEPEPLPPGDRWTRAAWAGLIGGPALLFVLAVVGAPVPGVIPGAAVVAFVAGLLVLLVRRGDHNRGDDPDHGAVL